MIYEDIAAAGSGCVALYGSCRCGATASPGSAGAGSFRRARRPRIRVDVAPRPAPPDQMIGPPGGSPRDGRDQRVLAELDATWDPGVRRPGSGAAPGAGEVSLKQVQPGPRSGAARHGDLVPQHQQLRVLGG